MSKPEKSEPTVIPFPAKGQGGGPEFGAPGSGHPSMDWLEEEAEMPDDFSISASSARQTGLETTDGGVPRRHPWLIGAVLGMLLCVAAFVLLRPAALPHSPALDIERGAQSPEGPPALDLGEAPPLALPPARAEPTPLPEATAVDPKDGTQTPPAELPGQEALPTQPVMDIPLPATNPEQSASGKPDSADDAAPVGTAEITGVHQRLDALFALVERLERSERVLTSRVNGLELAVLGQSADGIPLAGKPQKSRRHPKPTSPHPVASAQRPVKTADTQPLPFLVESVDTWNGVKTVVVRDGSRLVDLKPGDRHGGWLVESADGQAVTLRGPGGTVRTATVGGAPQ